MNPPIHDNILNGYDVDGVARRIVLHTVCEFATPQQYTDVIFDGVLDHYLRDTLLPSILYDIEPTDAEKVVHEHLAVMQSGFQRNGWPSFFDDRTDVMLRNIANSGCQFYIIGSSLGLDGWILADSCTWTPGNRG